MINLTEVRARLGRNGVRIVPSSLRLVAFEGKKRFLTVDSNKGMLMLKVIVSPVKERTYQRAKKEFYMSYFLAKLPEIPSVTFYAYGKDEEGNVFTVRKFSEGRPLQQAKHDAIHMKHLARILVRLHQIDVQGAGYISFRRKIMMTAYRSWDRFLLQSSYRSLNEMHEAHVIPRAEYDEYKHKIGFFFKNNSHHIVGIDGKLVHGDLSSGNIIIGDKNINAIIDWEFSISGDPAWEFVGEEYFSEALLQSYIEEMRRSQTGIDGRNFRNRIKILRVIKNLLIARSFVEDRKQFPIWWSEFCRLMDDAG